MGIGVCRKTAGERLLIIFYGKRRSALSLRRSLAGLDLNLHQVVFPFGDHPFLQQGVVIMIQDHPLHRSPAQGLQTWFGLFHSVNLHRLRIIRIWLRNIIPE